MLPSLPYSPDAHAAAFRRRFGVAPRLYRAPGRINLIGEHTDYNDGWVLPAAVNRYAWVAIAPRSDRTVVVRSAAFDQTIEFDLDGLAPTASRHWSNYLRGTAALLERGGIRLPGANVLIESDVPVGGGMSSSAAFEVAFGYALLREAGLSVDRSALAVACQHGDHEFVGIRCGIMDQFIACQGQRGHALLLDTRDLSHTSVPVPRDLRWVVCNTMVKHELATAAYNLRREECEAGVRALAAHLPGVTSLRDLGLEDFEQVSFDLDDVVYRRCWHVITENERTLAAATALRHGDFEEMGKLMGESHRSLRDQYEVSCRELDVMTEICERQPGVLGARMMGGGFGGCVLALARPDAVEELEQRVQREYRAATGLAPTFMVCNTADGAEAYAGTAIPTSSPV